MENVYLIYRIISKDKVGMTPNIFYPRLVTVDVRHILHWLVSNGNVSSDKMYDNANSYDVYYNTSWYKINWIMNRDNLFLCIDVEIAMQLEIKKCVNGKLCHDIHDWIVFKSWKDKIVSNIILKSIFSQYSAELSLSQ